MEKGTLVEFRLQGDAGTDRPRRLGVVDRPEGKKNWIVLDERSHPQTLHPRQISYEIAGDYKPSQIATFWQEIQPYLDLDSLEVAWELLVEDSESVDPASMALLLFSKQDPALCYAAYYLLSEDRLYFKQKGDRYEPRPATQVAELKHQSQQEAIRQQEWQGFLDRVQQQRVGESVEWQQSDRLRLETLEKYALYREESSHRLAAIEILTALDRPGTPLDAFGLLVDLGLWSPHENLALRRAQIPTQFSSRVVDMAHVWLSDPPPDPDQSRLDLTQLKVYTIDDESTREIDDGLSVEFLPEGQRIWIHIADPTRWITPSDELDLEARRRCTTIYLPTGMIPMFPSELATGPMSLNQGQICTALSFGVILDEAGGIQDYQIRASLIKPTYRLTYEDVDEMLELGIQAEPELEVLSRWAKQRASWRRAQGAISIHMPESSIKVQEDEITILLLEDSGARTLVAEMMILAGEVAGRYGEAHSLPLPFRGQPQPELPSEEELLKLQPGPVRYCAIRRCMPRSEVGTTPVRHASLGLDTYTQVTSPIRRYADLLAHFQIKAHLRGEPLPFSLDETKELIQTVGNTSYEATIVERQTNRYWSLEYLRRHPTEVWHALMLRWLREHENLGLVLLEDLGLEMAMRFNRDIEPGDRLDVKAVFVDPRQDIIQFAEAQVEQAIS
ncbi:MAG: ribonuclease R [Pegethrix bostrychoides GSE-TBD4-15B]|jgi:exoribonuclease-2|uniref:Ribonuclease R n=1 Tax=Pegethrix bostrychoides GSE-TBD4-15B TaxID=2839662 RepID=A0A951U398_9CYAN|nr:ribonuclease R [Pegethrix bostrychoides GSE-TBD4-15B]